MNLTFTTSNPNRKISFHYDPFIISILSGSDVITANGSTPGFASVAKEAKSVKLELKRAADLDVESAKGLRSDLKRKKGLVMKVRVDTRVRVEIGKMRTKKVILRVVCEGIHGTVPTGKTATVASTAESKYSVDLRFKIWKFTF